MTAFIFAGLCLGGLGFVIGYFGMPWLVITSLTLGGIGIASSILGMVIFMGDKGGSGSGALGGLILSVLLLMASGLFITGVAVGHYGF